MPNLPTGTVTFLFSDIEGSTRVLQQLGEGYSDLLAAHHRLLRTIFCERGGTEIGEEGDALFFVFSRASDAVAAAVAAQRAISSHEWPHGVTLRVRMGIHTGQPALTESGYVGLDVHRAARVAAAAHGGQVLLSQTSLDLARDECPEGTSFKDLGSHRLKDLEQPVHLYQVVGTGLRADFPALRSVAGVKDNLPRQLSSFIGRRKEISEICDALAKTPLVTITGVGGAGKSRLSLQAAAEMAGQFTDGVWLVELVGLLDPARVCQAIASVFGVREQPGRALVVTVSEFLATKSVLLVLDNCEHLLEECARLSVQLLQPAPRLKILATSREPLGIKGEWVYGVPPLSLPKVPALSPEELSSYESVTLFLERVNLASPGFALTSENATAIANLCRMLDGIPLAIELAAAWTKVLTIEQILQRLQDRLPQLSDRTRSSLPRHQTLQASLDWSFNPLSEPEKALLRRLSIFAGGFSLEAAEQVCSHGPVDRDGMLELLTHLIDKSLVAVERQGERIRYRLHEIVRQYCRARLDEAGETELLQGQHRDYFIALAEAGEHQLRGAAQPEWLDRLEADHDNLRAAYQSATRGSGDGKALKLASALWRFCEIRGYLTEGREMLKEALALGGSTYLQAKALDADGRLAWRQGDYHGAMSRFEASLELWRQAGETAGEATALNGLARANLNLGAYAEARRCGTQSLDLQQSLGDQQGIATSLNTIGEIARAEGDFATAAEYYQRSLSMFGKLGDVAATVSMLHNLGYSALAQEQDERAEAAFAEALRIAAALKDQMGVCHLLAGLAGVAIARRQPGRAAWLLGAAERSREIGGYVRERIDQAAVDRDISRARQMMDSAAFEEAWMRGRAAHPEEAIAFALGGLAEAEEPAPPGDLPFSARSGADHA